MISCRFPVAGCLLLLALGARAQNQYTPIQPLPLGDTLLSLPTSHMPAQGTWELKFTHRFNQNIDQGSFSDRIHTLFGLDSNADVGIGVSWVARRDLQFSFYRSNVMGDIEAGARYVVIQQAPAVPVSIAVRTGGDWRTARAITNRASWFAQAIVARQFGRRAEITIVPTFVTGAGRVVTGNTSTALFARAFSVPIELALRVHGNVSLAGELLPKNRDVPQTLRGSIGWAAGIKDAIGGHYFEILLTNSNATHADQYVTATYMGSPLRRSDLRIGFNIERRFGR